MLVKNWMTEKVVTCGPTASMSEAIQLMREHQIRILPIMKGDKIVGVVTDRDIKRASASDATTLEIHELLYLVSKLKLKGIMNSKPITVPWDYTIEEAAETMAQHKISGLPVVDHKQRLVGVITQTDVFKALISLTGSGRQGIQFAFMIEDQPGSIKVLTDIIRGYGGRLRSILTSYDRAPDGYRALYVRVFALDRKKLPELKSKLAAHATLLYMIDHRENKREIYEAHA
jgi:acetoin utilization protein AcuB